MEITDVLHTLSTNLSTYDITLYSPARADLFNKFKNSFGFDLPEDLKTMYRFCNGFESGEDLFRLIPLEENLEMRQAPRKNSFYIAEYMVYSDMWEVNVNPLEPNEYTISNTADTFRLLTHSIADFLARFLAGGVFGKGGLYDWHNEIDQSP